MPSAKNTRSDLPVRSARARRRQIPTIGIPGRATVESGHGYLSASRVSYEQVPANRRVLHRHPYFEVFWFSHGRGTHVSDFKRYPVAAGTLVFVTMGQVHSWDWRHGLRGCTVSFSTDDLGGKDERVWLLPELPFLFGVPVAPTLAVPKRLWADFDFLFESAVGEIASDAPLRLEAARALLRLILIRSERLFAVSGKTGQPMIAAALLTRSFLVELESSFLTSRQVQDYARKLGVTVNHLVETVRERTGRTPGELLDERLFLEAKRLLFHTTQTSAEIAFALGFKNPSHFGRFFKRFAHCSPGEARDRFHKTDQTFPR